MVNEDWVLVKDTGDYSLFVGKSEMMPTADTNIYILYNNKYDVVESETSCLPRALITLQGSANAVENLSGDVIEDATLARYEFMLDQLDAPDGQPTN